MMDNQVNKNAEVMQEQPAEQNRLKSWALWTSVAALVIYCAKQFFGWDIQGPVNALMDLLLPILVAFGIVNNPTNNKGL